MGQIKNISLPPQGLSPPNLKEVMKYNKELLLIKSHDPLIMCAVTSRDGASTNKVT